MDVYNICTVGKGELESAEQFVVTLDNEAKARSMSSGACRHVSHYPKTDWSRQSGWLLRPTHATISGFQATVVGEPGKDLLQNR